MLRGLQLSASKSCRKKGGSLKKNPAVSRLRTIDRDTLATVLHLHDIFNSARVPHASARVTVASNCLKRFQRPVSHAGASGFELVNPAGRWAPVLSSMVRPSQRENSATWHGDKRVSYRYGALPALHAGPQ